MKSDELRQLFADYYLEREHAWAAPASLIPENDASVLFTTAGMQPLIPYLMGQEHPLGRRLVNVQRCMRTGDIEEVGDSGHLTVFEMLGCWSLGDYFKKETINMSFGFLTDVLGIPLSRLAVTVHAGNEQIGADNEALAAWLALGIPREQIYLYGDDENWWGPVGDTGPCGPDSEMFYVHDGLECGVDCGPACNCGKYVELGNNVFMTYFKDSDGNLKELDQKNIDVGLGFERLLVLAATKNNIYETDLFHPLIEQVEELSGRVYNSETEKAFRIIADHIRAAVFVLSDPMGLVPSNTEQGYILRRLIRRTVRMLHILGIKHNVLPDLAQTVIAIYRGAYPEVEERREHVISQLTEEFKRFNTALETGLRMVERFLDELEPGGVLTGESAFRLYDTYGFPLEITVELAEEGGFTVDRAGFDKCFTEHQRLSRTASAGRFKGGLTEQSPMAVKLHTATHLLNSALREVLGEGVRQRGSNINGERLRFDFSFERKLSGDELKEIENRVNRAIRDGIPVSSREMTVDEARADGAVGVFDARYGDRVKVYEIPGRSKEICGGPHVENTGELGVFRIVKEQSSSAGVRRIRAVLYAETE